MVRSVETQFCEWKSYRKRYPASGFSDGEWMEKKRRPVGVPAAVGMG
jgi:hypothetical protein